MHSIQSRRHFLASVTAAGAAGVFGTRAALAAEPPPEVTTIRVAYTPEFACVAPRTIVEESLRAEGFTDVRLLPPPASVINGTLDFNSETAAWLVSNVDAGEPITVLTGMHVGCYELFVHEPIRTISDLKGRKVGINDLGSGAHLYLTIMIAQVGLDPKAMSNGSCRRTATSRSYSSPVRSTRFSAFPRSRRSCVHAGSVGSSSTRPRMRRGRITSAV
jgi:NitT/TauT family transport system substrate-binding protein